MAADFIDLLAWQEGVALVREVVHLGPQVRGAGAEEVVDQLLCAAESVAANVADGYEQRFGRCFARFLRVAAASAAEVESRVCVAEASGRLPAEAARELVRRARRVGKLIVGMHVGGLPARASASILTTTTCLPASTFPSRSSRRSTGRRGLSG